MIIKPRHNTKPKSRRDEIISPFSTGRRLRKRRSFGQGSIGLGFDFSIIITPLRGLSIFDSISDFRMQTNYSPHTINGRTPLIKYSKVA